MSRTPHGGRSTGARAQTSFDFVVGMSTFLVALMFAIGFIPGMFGPFTGDTGEYMIVADRSAARLTEDLLVESTSDPGSLNGTCTTEFFDGDGDVADCRFGNDSDDLHAALGVSDLTRLNATIEANGSVRTLSGTRLEAGPSPGPNTALTVSRRMVFLDGNESTLFVRVW